MQFNKYDAIVLCKIPTGNHFLPVEMGTWEGIYIRDRTCALGGNVNEIADYILICPFVTKKKNILLQKNIIILGQIH